jgi:endogenous inhibitor of DNA gyrase (YacG/DUF329 family)
MSSSDPGAAPLSGAARCPICRKPASGPHRPFCSARCRDVDLGRRLKEGYRIESDDAPEAPDGDP